VLLTLSSTILGGRVFQQWISISESSVLEARGKSAVRGLKLLFNNVGLMEKRIKLYITSLDEDDKRVILRNYEELIIMCNVLQEESVSSIENWTDIVPEADIKTLIGQFTSLKSEINVKEEELSELNSKLTDEKGQSEEAKQNLKEKISDKEDQIRSLSRQLLEAKANYGGGIGSLLSSTSSGISRGLLSSGSDYTIPDEKNHLGLFEFENSEITRHKLSDIHKLTSVYKDDSED